MRKRHAKADAEHEARLASAEEKRKRKEEFLAKIRDINNETYRLNHDLTLRIAHSKIRVTMKGHGYFRNATPQIKQIILDAANHFGGRFNSEYNVWEFWPPESSVISFYDDLRHFIRPLLEKKPDLPPEPKPTLDQPPISIRPPLNPDEEELFDERAAIMESEGGLSREEAEKRTFAEIKGLHLQRLNCR